jgi:hypothetical protein
MYVDPRDHTTATLFGNGAAMQVVARRGTVGTESSAYPAGAVLALVTWAQRDDPHWFGGRIPNAPQSVEFVQIASDRKADAYRVFGRSAFVEEHVDAKTAAQRTSFIMNLNPARIP